MALTLEDLLNLIEESMKGETRYEFPRGNAQIIVSVTSKDNNQESEGEDEEEEEVVQEVMKPQEALEICACMEQLYIKYAKAAGGVSILGLQGQLWKLCSHFHCLEDQSHVQTTLPALWS